MTLCITLCISAQTLMPWGLEQGAVKRGSAAPQVASSRSFELYAQTVNDPVGNSVDSASKPCWYWPVTRCTKIKHPQKLTFKVPKSNKNKGLSHKKRTSNTFQSANLCLRFTENELFYRTVNDPVYNPRNILANPYPAWAGTECFFYRQFVTT